jgi:hypothetical protein
LDVGNLDVGNLDVGNLDVEIETYQHGTGLPDGVINTKMPLWVNFGGPWNGKCWYMYVAIWNN